MKEENLRSGATDRTFWILFAAGWTVYAGLLLATGAMEGHNPLFALVSTFSPAAFATIVASQRRALLRSEWSLWKTVGVQVAVGFAYAVVSGLSTTALLVSMDLYDPEVMGASQEVLPVLFAFYYLLLYTVLAGFMMWTESLKRVQESQARAAREAVLRAEAEAKAVRAQFNPHFVFNTLHSLMLLVRADPKAAEGAIEDVAALIRYAATLDRHDQDTVRLFQELEVARRYLNLESLRLAGRLQVEWEVDEDIDSIPVPPFSLQTLLENAIKHGIAPKPEGGTVRIVAQRDSGQLLVSVRDDGMGADPEEVREAEGKGLSLLERRVSTLFPGTSSLSWHTAPGEGFSALLRVPISLPHEGRAAMDAGDLSGDSGS